MVATKLVHEIFIVFDLKLSFCQVLYEQTAFLDDLVYSIIHIVELAIKGVITFHRFIDTACHASLLSSINENG